jgi:ABC-type glycerol-3-phosphate transport system permease component
MALGDYGTDWGILTSGSFVGLIPILIMFIFLQKYFVKGMMSGALK